MSFKISPKDICQKQTQYCKAIILQLKINKPKKKKKKPSTRKKVSPKKFKNLGINLSKEVKNLHAESYKILRNKRRFKETEK